MIYLWSFKTKDKLDKTFLLPPPGKAGAGNLQGSPAVWLPQAACWRR